ncbi:MAG: hypothetical protein JST01_28770 [Cyanobacteria bacterium SZAS TMP-1]|nr:hypothetical protein [Cyanobacteria bacterium SZAS TMP-1]
MSFTLGMLLLESVTPGLAHGVPSVTWTPNSIPASHANLVSQTAGGWTNHAAHQATNNDSSSLRLPTSVNGAQNANNLVTPRTIHFNHHAANYLNQAISNVHLQTLEIGQPHNKLELDLTSSAANIVLGSKLFGENPSVTIAVGDNKQQLHAGSVVTAGEFLAVQQVLTTGTQGISLSASGAAVGGSFSLNSVEKSHVSALVIPASVTAVDNVSNHAAIRLPGNLTNYGSIEIVATSSKANLLTISALDFTNAAGGVIVTLPSMSGNSATATPSILDLTLRATSDFVNAGSISTTGTLSIDAGGKIVNALPAGAGGPLPTITAAQGVNLLAGNGHLYNQGLISSATGDINVSASKAANIYINAAGGSFVATTGNINVRDMSYVGDGNVTLYGGDYVSKNLNLYSGSGEITGNVGRVTGNLNTKAAVEHFSADTANLVLGTNTIDGDPVFASTGNITISGVNTFSEDVAILAQGNITAGDSAAAIIAKGHNVALIAGAGVTTSGTLNAGTTDVPGSALNTGGGSGTGNAVKAPSADVSFKNSFGGNIDLSASSAPTIIDTGSTTGNGGSVTLIAVAKDAVGGTITLPSTSTINTSSNTGIAGNVLVMANAAPSTPTATIKIGNISASSGDSSQPSTKAVQIYTQGLTQPTASFNGDGSTFSGFSNDKNNMQNAGVTVGSINTAGYGGAGGTSSANAASGGLGGGVIISAGGNIVASGSIDTYGGGGGGVPQGSSKFAGFGGSGGDIDIRSVNGNVIVNGNVNTSGGGGGGGANPGASGFGGAPGNVTLMAPATVDVTGVVLAAGGGNGGTQGGGGSFGGGGGGAGSPTNTAGAGGGGLYGGGGGGNGDGLGHSGGGGAGGGASGSGGGGGGYDGAGGGAGGNGGTGGIAGSGTGMGGAGVGSIGNGGAGGGVGGDGGSGAVGSGAGGSGAGSGGSSGLAQANFGVGGSDGGAAGSNTFSTGTIFITGRNVLIEDSISSGGKFSGDSVISGGSRGVTITNQAQIVGTTQYLPNADYTDPTRSASAPTISGSASFAVGAFPVVSGSSGSIIGPTVAINGQTTTSPVTTGTFSNSVMTLNEAGGNPFMVSTGTKVSAAEYLSVVELGEGTQGLYLTYSNIGAGGATATSGSFSINAQNLPTGGSFGVFNLPLFVTANVNVPLLKTAPAKVDGNIIFSTASGSLFVVGNLTANGTIRFNGNLDSAIMAVGDIRLQGQVIGTVSGSTESIVAANDIFTSGLYSPRDSSTAVNLNLIAGVNLTLGPSDVVTFSTHSFNGGSVRGSGLIVTNGGNLLEVASPGVGTANGGFGTIQMSNSANTGSPHGGHNNGSVTLIASDSINYGPITTSGAPGTGDGGSVTIIGATPTVNGGVATIKNSVLSPVSTFNTTTPVLSSVSIGIQSITTIGSAGMGGAGSGGAGDAGGNGGNIMITTNGFIGTGTLLTYGGGGGGGGSSYSGNGGVGGAGGNGGSIFLIQYNGNSLQVSGDINTSGGGGGGGGGAGAGSAAGSAGSGGTGGKGGVLNISAAGGTITVTGGIYTVGGGAGGAGSSKIGANGGGGGGSLGAGGGGGAGGGNSGAGGGGGGYTTALSFVSGGGGGDATGSGTASGGSGGGYNGINIAAGIGGTGNIPTNSGSSGSATSGGDGFSGNSGGLNSLGAGGSAGTTMFDPATNGSNFGSTPSGDASITLSSKNIMLSSSAATTTVYGGDININALSVGSKPNQYLSDADYGSAANSYSPVISAGTLQNKGDIKASGILTLNQAVQTSPLSAGLYNPSTITITESGTPVTIGSSDMVTPAEYVAIIQVISGAQQTLILSGTAPGTGIATSGSMTISSLNIPTGGFTNLNLPGTAATLTALVTAPALTYSGSATIKGALNFTSPSSQLTIGSSTNVTGAITFAGAGNVTSNGNFTVSGADGITANDTLAIVCTTGDITLSSPIGGKLITITTTASAGNIVVNGTGAVMSLQNLQMTSGPSGSITLNTGSQLSGNFVTLNSPSISNNGIVTATGSAPGFLQVISPGALSITGNGSWISPNSFSLQAAGNLNVGNLFSAGQPVSTHQLIIDAPTGVVTLPVNSLAVTANATDGGSITLNAKSLMLANSSLPLSLNADASPISGNGGTISVTLTDTTPVTLMTGGTLAISALPGSTAGNGGKVAVTVGGDLTVTASFLNLAPTASGEGGSISLTAGTSGKGKLTLTESTINVDGVGNGAGGAITLQAPTIVPTGTSPLSLSAKGSGSGSGGTITVETTGTATITIGSAKGNISINASGGSGGTFATPANGGRIVVSSGGGLTVNAGLLLAAPGGQSGKGSDFILTSGTTTTGNLAIAGGLNADGIGNGNGGNINLTANGTTNLTLGSGSVQGPLSAQASGTGTGGSIAVQTHGNGGITVGTPLVATSQVFLMTDKGKITINANIGNATTDVFISPNAGGLSSSTKAVIAGNTLDISGTTGAITLPDVVAANVSVYAYDKTPISITNPTASPINILKAQAGNIAFKSQGDLNVTGKIYTNTGTVSLTSAADIFVAPAGSVYSQKAMTVSVTGASSTFTSDGVIDTSAAGSLSVTAPNSTSAAAINFETGSKTGAAKSLVLTASKGSIKTYNLGAINLSVPLTVTVSAYQDITTSGAIYAQNSITEKTTNIGTKAVPSTSTITMLGGMETNGTITLTSTGSGGIVCSGPGTLDPGKAAVLTASRGSITVNSIGFTNLPDAVTLTALTNIITTNNIQAAGSVTIQTTATKSISEVNIGGQISASGSNGSVTVTNAGIVGANSGIVATAPISATKSIGFTASAGDISVAALTAGTKVKATAFDQFAANGTVTGTTGVTISTTATTGANKGSITLSSITAGNSALPNSAGGAISVIAAGGTLTVNPGAAIKAFSDKTTKASITLENNLITGSGGNIVVGGGADIVTSGKFGSNVNIVMGAVPASVKGNTLPVIAGVTFNPNNPQSVIFVGASAINNGINFVSSGATNPINLNVIGAGVKLILNTGSLPASAITINGGTIATPTIITADPPVGANSLSVPTLELGSSGLQTGQTQSHPSHPLLVQTANSNLLNDTNVNDALIRAPQLNGSARPNQAPVESTFVGQYKSMLSTTNEIDAPLLYEQSENDDTAWKCNGNYLVIPKRNTTIRTGNCTIDVAAGSAALVMCTPESTSIYNLHDIRKNSVVISANGHREILSPGRHATFTSQLVQQFEMINPAECFEYGTLATKAIGKMAQVMTSDFSLLQAVGTIKQLKSLINSPATQDKSVSNQLLKTAAIMSQLNAGKEYRRHEHPKLTATALR